ncbi:heavy metal translocating P-type ATPase [Intestinibacter bartlettii]|uniref:Cd(2+)-exporting ATPase n=1 Tax=Intestinibacter bartlettii CAG:1329 TaxID=1263063 RepID=R5Y0H9_9FIRM|nr:cation-translocating P-type ATPase [Intestinibacter bartlettii]CDA10192.1 cadmium-exporting ATPase [Intestinibacter bartlettii CAG:1329]
MKLFKSETQKTVTFIIISSICLFMSLIQSVDELLHFNLSWVAIILCGLPIIKEAATCLYEEFDIKADVLVSLALIASVIIGEIFAAGEISVIMTIGALLEDLTVQKAKSGIENLVKLTPKQARIIRDNKEIMINADDIEIGDIVRVIVGETIPVDGVIIKGQGSIDESIMNGESLPVDKYVGDDVLSGTINQYSTFDIKATKTSIMASIGNASKYGMLIKGGDVVERLSKIKNIAFDKTGTLTYGKLSVVEYKSFNPEYDDEALLKILASVEAYSEHPLGKAIISYYKENNEELLDIQNFTVNPGKGITANLGEKSISVGNLKLIKDVDINLNKDIINISEEFTKKGCTVIYLSIDNKLIGYVALSDILREEAKEVISYIKSQKINPVMLTGDNKNSAQNIASIVGIDDINPSLLPEDKMNIIKNLEDSKSPTCMIGDGVNDALALKYSSVGISMGAIGSDIAIEASDIALASDDIKNIPYLLYLSKKTMKTIKLNVTFSLALNFLAIILAMTGILNPVVGALVHNLGSVFVILNSAKLLKTRNNLDLHIKIEYEVTNKSKGALIV